MPQVQDPFFRQAVVLLASHDEDGSVGFVVNNSTELLLETVLHDLKIPWQGQASKPALLGGPVSPQTGTILIPTAATLTFEPGQAHEIAPGISITQDVHALRSLAEAPPEGLRLLLGHAGWSPGQLDQEVERHDWLVCPAHADLVFANDVERLWNLSLGKIGVSASELPAWAPDSEVVN